MSDLFLGAQAPRTGTLARLDPRTKLIGALSLSGLSLCSQNPAPAFAVAGVCLGGLFFIGLPWRMIRPRLTALLGMTAVMVLLQAWAARSLSQALHLGARACGCASVLLLLGLLSPADQVLAALRWMAVPEIFLEIVSLMHRYAFVLIGRARDIVAAQWVRLGYCGIKRSLSSMAVMEGALVIGSVDQAFAVFDAMHVRGYTGRMPASPLPEMSPADWAAAALAPLVCLAAYVKFGRIGA
ncbi:MAG: hypothetical protein HKL90_03525 [Elusimicrobia bacterium]|nr:hypothetical protein [Elusimicrobiota bacterium]